MAFPKFSKAGMADFTFSRGNVYPAPPRVYEPVQRVGRSYAGTFRVATLRAPEERFPLVFERLPVADYTGLLAWLQDVNINWAAKSFTFTDATGTAATVRYLGGLTMPQVANGLYSVTIELIKEP